MSLPNLGVGIVYVPGLEPLLESRPDLITAVEIEPQTLWHHLPDRANPYRLQPEALELLHAFPQSKIIHGVGFPVGGSRPPDPRHLPLLVEMIEALDVPWASEHLAFNQANGPQGDFHTGFMLPPLQTLEGVKAAVATIRKVSSALPVPFAIETGVNYLRPRKGELTDGAFVSMVAEGADCGILLDLHNLWANERNGRQSVEEFLREIPLERVWEVHLAGGNELSGYWLDAHSDAVPDPVLELAARIIPALPNLRAIVFEILPTFVPRLGLDGIVDQLERLHELWVSRNDHAEAGHARLQRKVAATQDGITPGVWEDTLGALAIGGEAEGELGAELKDDPGVRIIQKLVWDFRAGMIASTLQLTIRLLMLQKGEAFTRGVLTSFFKQTPPQVFASAEAEAFASFLASHQPDVLYLPEVLAFDRAVMETLTSGESRTVRFPYEPDPLLQALREGRLPEHPPEEGCFEIEITP